MPIMLLGLVAGNLAVGFALGKFVHPMLFARDEQVYVAPVPPAPLQVVTEQQPEPVKALQKPIDPMDDSPGFVKF